MYLNYFILFIFLATMSQGTQKESYSLLGFHLIWFDKDEGQLCSVTYSFVGEDIKQDAFLTWACLYYILKHLVSKIKFKL